MAPRPTGTMPDFCTPSDDDGAVTGTFEGDGTVDCTRKDTFVGRAPGVALGSASA